MAEYEAVRVEDHSLPESRAQARLPADDTRPWRLLGLVLCLLSTVVACGLLVLVVRGLAWLGEVLS